LLTKPKIIEFSDLVLEKWNGNLTLNASDIFAMTTLKTRVAWADDDLLKAIWNDILKYLFELFYENVLARDDESWGNVMKKLKNKK
jgi:hypothetical protein